MTRPTNPSLVERAPNLILPTRPIVLQGSGIGLRRSARRPELEHFSMFAFTPKDGVIGRQPVDS
jgi:hypothetical protein